MVHSDNLEKHSRLIRRSWRSYTHGISILTKNLNLRIESKRLPRSQIFWCPRRLTYIYFKFHNKIGIFKTFSMKMTELTRKYVFWWRTYVGDDQLRLGTSNSILTHRLWNFEVYPFTKVRFMWKVSNETYDWLKI